MEKAELEAGTLTVNLTLAWVTLNSSLLFPTQKGTKGETSLLFTYYSTKFAFEPPPPRPHGRRSSCSGSETKRPGRVHSNTGNRSFALTPGSSLSSTHVMLLAGQHSIPGRPPIPSKVQLTKNFLEGTRTAPGRARTRTAAGHLVGRLSEGKGAPSSLHPWHLAFLPQPWP